GVEFHNFALGGCRSVQKIYALTKNINLIEKSKLIIIETNINEQLSSLHGVSFEAIQRDFKLFCKMLASLNKPILFIIFPLYEEPFKNKYYEQSKIRAINNLHLLQIKKYAFNFINMQQYYEENGIKEFFKTNDWWHQLPSIMKTLGQNIIFNLKEFKSENVEINQIPNFFAATLQDVFENVNELKKEVKKNSLFKEEVYKLSKKSRLVFKKKFQNWILLGFGVWNGKLDEFDGGCVISLIFENQKTKIVKFCRSNWFVMHGLKDGFCIDEESFLYFNADNEKQTEPSDSAGVFLDLDYANTLNVANLTNQILLVKPDENFKIDAHYDFNVLANLEVQIDEKYNFSHLIPDVVLFKEIIEEYNARMDPVKIAPLQAEIKNLKLELHQKKQNPIQTHLAYKLGRAIIENYRSFWGFLGLPFVLNYIAKKHKKEANILPCDENEKQILSYQLGLAFIKAHKAWYKGGYMWFIFRALSLKKQFGR
ncbi:hypothetical protein, partial [Campylobacter upsaliensis]|uniref:hypothetical protein n=1 Tax=Campylobacter upsaliensis TaxID=28080 RepID=UPI0039EB1EFD